MPYFLSDKKLVSGTLVDLGGEEALHLLLSHRVKVGEAVALQGPDGQRFSCQVTHVGKKTLSLLPGEQVSVPEEPEVKVTLFQAAVSEKVLDMILQKSVELGASKVVFFNSQNSPAKMTVEKFEAKKIRWEKICWESAKQCGRGVVPEIEFITNFPETLKIFINLNKVLVADIGGQAAKALVPVIENVKSIGIVVGPEGGFSQEEQISFNSRANIIPVSLGSLTLRAETAAISLLSIIRLIGI